MMATPEPTGVAVSSCRISVEPSCQYQSFPVSTPMMPTVCAVAGEPTKISGACDSG